MYVLIQRNSGPNYKRLLLSSSYKVNNILISLYLTLNCFIYIIVLTSNFKQALEVPNVFYSYDCIVFYYNSHDKLSASKLLETNLYNFARPVLVSLFFTPQTQRFLKYPDRINVSRVTFHKQRYLMTYPNDSFAAKCSLRT